MPPEEWLAWAVHALGEEQDLPTANHSCSYLEAADQERELQIPFYSAGPGYRPKKWSPMIVVSSYLFLEPRP